MPSPRRTSWASQPEGTPPIPTRQPYTAPIWWKTLPNWTKQISQKAHRLRNKLQFSQQCQKRSTSMVINMPNRSQKPRPRPPTAPPDSPLQSGGMRGTIKLPLPRGGTIYTPSRAVDRPNNLTNRGWCILYTLPICPYRYPRAGRNRRFDRGWPAGRYRYRNIFAR